MDNLTQNIFCLVKYVHRCDSKLNDKPWPEGCILILNQIVFFNTFSQVFYFTWFLSFHEMWCILAFCDVLQSVRCAPNYIFYCNVDKIISIYYAMRVKGKFWYYFNLRLQGFRSKLDNTAALLHGCQLLCSRSILDQFQKLLLPLVT